MNLGVLTVVAAFAATGAFAQQAHMQGTATETGQSQFAAIAEIVTLFRDDPTTEWQNVDIDGLRSHLVDMDNVTTKASATKFAEGMAISFTVVGGSEVAASIQRMAVAHSRMLEQATGWNVSTTTREDGATMLVEVGSAEERQQVLGLGFFGILTLGSQHQNHHLMIARGRSPH
jgi:hypothetical protein